MSNAIQADVQLLVQKELNSANEKFPPFNSAHEGYAVIKEEVEECIEELGAVKQGLDNLWLRIKDNATKERIDLYADGMKTVATNLACEAIQVAAMVQKLLDMGR